MRTHTHSQTPLLTSPSADLDAPQGLQGHLVRAEQDVLESARAARSWTLGTLGLGMMTASISYVAHGHEHGETWRAVAGGLAGAALWHIGTGDTRRAAHAGAPAAHRVIHHAHMGLLLVGISQVGLNSTHSGVRLVGALGTYLGALLAANAVNDTFLTKEARWHDNPEAKRTGNRWLAAGLLLAGVGTLILGWLAALVTSAAHHNSEAALVARWVATVVTLASGINVLPTLFKRLPHPTPDPNPA